MRPHTVARRNRRTVALSNSVTLCLQHLGTLVISLLLCVSTLAQSAQEARVLEPGQPVERELAGGQRHAYQLQLSAGQYLEISLEQRGIDVAVTLSGPDGKPLAQFDNDSRAQGRETVTQVVAATGGYQLIIAAKQRNAPPGSYAIRLVALRAATEQDRAVQAAPQLSVEVTRLANAARLDEQLPQAERALAVREQALGAEHPEVATALDRLASIIRNKGDLAKAEPLYLRALAIAEQTPAPGHAELGQILNDLATLYLRKGDLIQAEARFQRALTVWHETLGPEHSNVARALTNLGALYAGKGDSPQALPLFHRALEARERTLGPSHPDLVNTLINLGNLYYLDSEYARAETHYQRALQITDQAGGQETPTLALVLRNLANILTYKRDFARAEPILRRAQTISEKTQGPEHPDVAVALNNRAFLYDYQGEYDQAEPLHQRALALREKALGPEHSIVAFTLNSLAQVSIAKGNFQQALASLTRASSISEKNIAFNLAVGAERQKLAYLATLAKETSRVISLHTRFAPTDAEAGRLALTTILRRKGRALDAMSDSIAALRRRATPEDQKLLDQVKETRAQLARLVLNGPQRLTPAEHQSRIQTLEAQREKLEDEISRRSASFRAQAQPVTLEAVQAALPARTALVEFAVYRPCNAKFTRVDELFGPPRYVAYVLHPQGETQWVDLGEQQVIDAAVERLRRALRNRQEVKRLARAVDQLVMRPIRPLLGQTRRVLLAPDGVLNLIPFAALVDARGHYLVQHYNFSYLTSGRDLLRLQVKQPSKQSALIVANPDFGVAPQMTATAGERLLKYRPAAPATPTTPATQTGTAGALLAGAYFPPLAGTADEAQLLKALLPEARLLTQAQATEAALKQVASPSILHVATHGFFLGDATDNEDGRGLKLKLSAEAEADSARLENPLLRSGLALAGANQLQSGQADDGILTALEAASLDLWGTKLVVLSACDTGVGEVKNGEGVYGLRRALLLAGCETQVMSLWPVADRATQRYMVDYYRRLQRGAGRADALRAVQLKMLSSKQPGGPEAGEVARMLKLRKLAGGARDYRHPYYWASFIQSGEWANLAGER